MRSKKEREDDIFKFWKILGEYPKAEVCTQKPPDPDFFAKTEDGLIGIEHTSLVRSKDERGVDLALHYSVAKEIVNCAWQEFQKKYDLDLFVGISFCCDYGISRGEHPVWLHKGDIDDLKKEIVDAVSENIPEKSKSTFVRKYDDEGSQILSKKLEYIFINNINGRYKSAWSAEKATIVPRLNPKNINSILAKKNSKPSNYLKNYSQIWLVIVEHSFQIETLFNFEDNDLLKSKFSSSFDRIFIYRLVENEIFELDTKDIR